MKCPHCGAQIGLEEKYCPFCGLPNEFARKHQEDMDRYEQEFQQTQSEVYQKTRHFTSLTVPLTVIFVLILLNIVSFVFSKYLDIFKGFSITYGSLTTLMLIMMWTYSCFYTLFLGAEINKMLERPSVLEEREGKQF